MQAMADTLGALHSCLFHGSVGWLGFQMMIASSWCKDLLALHFGLCIHDPIETNSVSFAAIKTSFFELFVIKCHIVGIGLDMRQRKKLHK